MREQPAGARLQVVQCGQALAAEYLAHLERRGAGCSGLADQLRKFVARSRLREAEAGKGAHKQSRRHWTSVSGALRESICERAASSRRSGGCAPAPWSRSPRAKDAPWSRSEDAPPPVALSPILLLVAMHQPGYILTNGTLASAQHDPTEHRSTGPLAKRWQPMSTNKCREGTEELRRHRGTCPEWCASGSRILLGPIS